MNNVKHEIILLLDKYVAGICTDEECDKLFSYLSNGNYDTILNLHIKQMLEKSALVDYEEGMNKNKSNVIIEKILTYGERNHDTISLNKPKSKNILFRGIVAASILGIILFGTIQLFHKNIVKNQLYYASGTYYNTLTEENKTSTPKNLHLDDGSLVTLAPGAKLIYPVTMKNVKERDVYLLGNAYFEIAKDAKHPFVVFHNNLVTKVLGTRFFIKQDNINNQSEVEVRSGKVEVFENLKLLANRSKLNDGAIITPNQKVVYAEDKRMFSTTIIDEPLPTVEKDSDGNVLHYNNHLFEFKSASVKMIIPLIEKYYGIKLEVENEALNNCLFTGDISMENLYTKMDILCSSLGSTYEIKGINILIKGDGCF